MTQFVLAVFVVVYGGMILGGLPGLGLDRTGVAVLGAMALIAGGALDVQAAWLAVDAPTMALLFGLMVVSAQFRLGGFYTAVTRRVAQAQLSPRRLLGLVMLVAAALSAVLANDIVCLAMAPILLEGCVRRGLNPTPFLLGLACASNVGSAATLIGNPQNMLIGQALGMDFAAYLLDALPPTLAGLAASWLILCAMSRGRWHRLMPQVQVEAPDLNRWQTGKGLMALAVLLAGFLFSPMPREALALAVAAVLLMSRRLASRRFFALIDGQLLLLFMGLFVLNRAMAQSGASEMMFGLVRSAGVDLGRPAWLFAVTVVLSNVVSNVPAVMLLLPAASSHEGGLLLALASTLAGNLVLVGSIANLIVVDRAERLGLRIGWLEHLRVGVPVTLATLLAAAAWMWLIAPAG